MKKMMEKGVFKLPYIQAESKLLETPFGYQFMPNINVYNSLKTRGYSIIRVDILRGLSFFNEKTIEKYRNAIFGLFGGLIDDEDQILTLLKMFYEEDDDFKNAFDSFFYFNNEGVVGTSLYDRFMEFFYTNVATIKAEINTIRGSCAIHIGYSSFYDYRAIKDDISEVTLPKGLVGECINGKVRFIYC